MKTVHITRKERFSAAHRLYREDYSDEKNLEVFGKCSNPNWHGHNYTLLVTVKGIVHDETGFVADLKAVSRIIREKVITKVDHRNINLDRQKSATFQRFKYAKVLWVHRIRPSPKCAKERHRRHACA